MLEGLPPVLLECDSNDTDTDIRSLAFLSRLTEALHASPFDSDLGCDAISGSISKFLHFFYKTDPVVLMVSNQIFVAASRYCANSPSPSGEAS